MKNGLSQATSVRNYIFFWQSKYQITYMYNFLQFTNTFVEALWMDK